MVNQMQGVARVFAIAVATSARLQAMKVENYDRRENGLALAYDEKSFTQLGEELLSATRSEIGL